VTAGGLAGRAELYWHALECEERCYHNAQRERIESMIPLAQAAIADPGSPDREFWSTWWTQNRQLWPELFAARIQPSTSNERRKAFMEELDQYIEKEEILRRDRIRARMIAELEEAATRPTILLSTKKWIADQIERIRAGEPARKAGRP
jgi:hypothetical protein